MYYALIKKGTVENIIIADNNFVQKIRQNFDDIIDVTSLEQRPSIGFNHLGGLNFSDPTPPPVEIPQTIPPEKERLLQVKQQIRGMNVSQLSDVVYDLVNLLIK